MNHRSSRSSRLVAGLVAPVAACFIWSLATGSPAPFGTLGLALVLGAPISVPVALVAAPRRLWLALPVISLVAAVGINAQMQAIFSDNPFSTVLVAFWAIPAILGAGTALLLRCCDHPIWLAVIGIVASIALSAIAFHDRPTPDDPKYVSVARIWSEVRPGIRVYIGGDSDRASQTICPNLSAYLRFEQTGKALDCTHAAHGIPVIVESVIPCTRTDPSFGYEAPKARIRAVDGSWHGITTAANFQPDIPAGTILRLDRDWGAPLSMLRGNKRVDLGGTATVRLLRYDPKADDGSTLYVRVLDGPHAGEVGWTGIQLVDSGDVSLGAYDMAYPTEDCF